MVSIETITEELDSLGFNPPDNVLQKCLEICERYDVVDPAEFAETWMAYSVSKCDGVEPTIDLLKDMESREYVNKVKQAVPKQTFQSSSASEPANELIVYKNNDVDMDGDDVLGSYAYNTPKAKRSLSRIHTPLNKIDFSPASYSPITPNRIQNPDQPTQSGNVVYTFGNSQLVKQTKWEAEDNTEKDIQIKLSTTSKNEFVAEDSKYMYDTIFERALIIGARVYEVGKEIYEEVKKKFVKEDEKSDEIVEITHVDVQGQDKVFCLGRIACGDDPKIQNNISLVDFDEMTLRFMPLDFSRSRSYAVFPGQTVIVKGSNPRGNQFLVEEIYSESQLVLSDPPNLEKDVSFVVAAAPFTEKGDLLYEKLDTLLKYCNKSNPDVLILTGPIADARVDLFVDIVAQEFEDYFQVIMDKIITNIKPQTQVVVVSNHEDIVSSFAYPTHPYEMKRFYSNLHFVPDPCILNVNGISVGVTSVDVLKDLSDNERSANVSKDPVKRVFSYMFNQKSFYPLNPPSESMPVDVDLLNQFGNIIKVPNVMICPSDLNVFVREINNCVCINPGHLSDLKTNGTFARMVVHPPKMENAKPFNYVACQVVKS